MLTDQEKQMLKNLVKKELEEFEKEESTIVIPEGLDFVKGEQEYEKFLKGLLEKLQ